LSCLGKISSFCSPLTLDRFFSHFSVGWLLVSFFTLMVGLSLAEICSAFPTSGGLYVWTTRLCSAAWAPIASWTVGYTNWLGLVCRRQQQQRGEERRGGKAKTACFLSLSLIFFLGLLDLHTSFLPCHHLRRPLHVPLRSRPTDRAPPTPCDSTFPLVWKGTHMFFDNGRLSFVSVQDDG